MIVFDIVFQNGDFYNQSSSSFIPALLGALIGAGTSLFVFYSKIKVDKNKEKQDKKASAQQTLIYFSTVIDNVITQAEHQSKRYIEHSQDIQKDPFVFHRMSLSVSNDLSRVINDFEHFRLFHSYIGEFENKEDSIKAFSNIFRILDFFAKMYEVMGETQENYKATLFAGVEKLRNLSEEQVVNYSVFRFKEIEKQDIDYSTDELYIVLKGLINGFYKKYQKGYSFEQLQTELIQPLSEKLDKLSNSEVAFDILNRCRAASWCYEEMVEQSKEDAASFFEAGNQLQEKILDLKNISKELFDLIKDYKVVA
jgi:hypothetical protein